MYKLTVISGPNRGSSYALQQGVLSIGRQSGNTIVLASSKVSKQHCAITVDNGEIVLKDVGSSNGTFVNGVLTKLRKIKPGDRISVGEYVFQVVEPQMKVMKVAPAVAGLGNPLQFSNGPATPMPGAVGGFTGVSEAGPQNRMPTDLKGRALWLFENRLMPIFYGMNLKYEWKVLCLGMLGAFILGNLFLTVYPLMAANRTAVIQETARRARFMARQIAEQNAPYLAAHAETKTEIGIVDNAEGVRLALLTDLDNRIIAPGAKLNQYLANGAEAAIAIKARDAFRNGKETGIVLESDDSTVVAIEPVKVLNPNLGRNVIAAMAIVAIDSTLSTPDIGEMSVVYAETLILTGILGGIILIILYRITLKPFEILNEDMDKALKGDLPRVTHEFKCEELNSLWEIINSAIQRIPKAGGDMAGAGDGGGLVPSVDEFLGPLRLFGNIVKFGIVVFDHDKKIVHLNPVFEEISGIRIDSALGHEMTEVARDQSMGAFTSDILSRAPVGGEGVSEDYDFSGITYKMHAAAFGSMGGMAKCYIMAAVKGED